MSVRLTREERRARTRDDLLDAAARVFAARGFHGASVDDVAADAGYTVGAVYSNFTGKEDLFLAGFEREIARHSREVTEAVEAAGDDPVARTQAAAAQWMAWLDRAPDMFKLFVEYWAWAVRDEGHRERFAARFAAFRDNTVAMIAAAGLPTSVPIEDLAVAANALIYGISFQRLVEPEAVPDDLVARSLGLLLRGAVAPS